MIKYCRKQIVVYSLRTYLFHPIQEIIKDCYENDGVKRPLGV